MICDDKGEEGSLPSLKKHDIINEQPLTRQIKGVTSNKLSHLVYIYQIEIMEPFRILDPFTNYSFCSLGDIFMSHKTKINLSVADLSEEIFILEATLHGTKTCIWLRNYLVLFLNIGVFNRVSQELWNWRLNSGHPRFFLYFGVYIHRFYSKQISDHFFSGEKISQDLSLQEKLLPYPQLFQKQK